MSILPKENYEKSVISVPAGADVNTVPGPAAEVFNDAHPLEHRVANWKANEEAFKLKLLQRSQGLAEPIKRSMEMKIVQESTFVPSALGGPSNVHLDILKNNDASIDWDDVYKEEDNKFDFHAELQKKMGI